MGTVIIPGRGYKGDYSRSNKIQTKKVWEKAVEFANEVLKTTGNCCEAIDTGLRRVREHFAKEKAAAK